MLGSALRGMVAGAMGTVALDITGYMDMVIRGRSASNALYLELRKGTRDARDE